jgi:hypothetical protein
MRNFLLENMKKKFERFRFRRLVKSDCLILFPGMSSRLPIGHLAVWGGEGAVAGPDMKAHEGNLYTCCYGAVKARCTLTTQLAAQPRSCGLNPIKARDLTILQNE